MKAYWNDVSGGKHQIAIVGSGDNAKQLRPTYASQDDAQQAAKAEWERIKRGIAEFEITLAQGRADVMPESPLRTLGFKADIDATDWVVTEVTHVLSDSGYVTQAKCETSSAVEDGAEKEAIEWASVLKKREGMVAAGKNFKVRGEKNPAIGEKPGEINVSLF